jgi:hypothetical protein
MKIITAAVAVGLLMNGCAPQHTTPAAPGPYHIDIARLQGMTADLPPGATVVPQPMHTLTKSDVDNASAALSALTVTPPECLKMATAHLGQVVGTVATSLSAQDKQFGVVISASQAPAPLPTSAAVPVCSAFDVERPDGAVSHTRVLDAAMVPDAARTSATHSITTGGDAGDRVVDQYEYVAQLDDRHLVTVTSFANPTDSQAVGERLPRLLTAAVNAVRWRD